MIKAINLAMHHQGFTRTSDIALELGVSEPVAARIRENGINPAHHHKSIQIRLSRFILATLLGLLITEQLTDYQDLLYWCHHGNIDLDLAIDYALNGTGKHSESIDRVQDDWQQLKVLSRLTPRHEILSILATD